MKEARDRLAERFANDEISETEYKTLLAAIARNYDSSRTSEERDFEKTASLRKTAKKTSSHELSTSSKVAMFFLGLIVSVLAIGFFIQNKVRPHLEAVSVTAKGVLAPKVIAVLHNTGSADTYSFEVEDSSGNILCLGGRQFFAANERREIVISCPGMINHIGDYNLNWSRQ